MRLVHFVLTIAFIQLISLLAFAQEDPRKKQAEAPFEQGLKLHDQGNDAEALEKFREAHRIYPSPNALFQIARSEELIGRSLDAMGHYREALKSPVLHPKNATLGRQYVAALERRLGRVEVVGPAGMTVTVLGKEYRLPLDEPIDVEPGSVVATGVYGNDRYEGRVLGVAGTVATMKMTLAEPAAATARQETPPPHEAPPPIVKSDGFWTTRRVVGAAIGGGGLAALVGGVVLVLAANEEGDAGRRATAGTSTCVGVDSPGCREGLAAAEREADFRTGAALSFIGGGILAAAGAALVLWPSTSANSAPSSLLSFHPVAGSSVRVRGSMLQWEQSF